jgi:hypothetical protein
MNMWFRRAVGTVGVAGGILLLGAGAAHADDTLAPGQLDDLFSPAGGPNNQSLQLEAHGSRIDTSADSSTQAGRRTTTTQVGNPQLPNLLSFLPTEMLGLPRTTSSKVSNISAVPGRTLPTEDSVAALPLVGSLQQWGLPGVSGVPVDAGDTLQGASIADTSNAFPSVGTEATSLPVGNTAGGGLPLVGGLGGGTGALPLIGGLPVQGTLKPVDDLAIPVGAGRRSAGQHGQRGQRVQRVQHSSEADSGLPMVGELPLGGSDVLKNDSVTGVPVIGGIGPTPGVSTTAVARRVVPTTGALPQAASQLPLVAEKTYAPRHASTYRPRHSSAAEEALPVVGGLPLLNGVAGGNLPLVGGLLGGR